jgi:hypothetical protein
MKTIRLDLNNISKTRFERRLERLKAGRPLKFKEVRERDPEKRRLLLAFNLRTSPPAKEILSGKAFRDLLGTRCKPGPRKGTRTTKEPKSRIVPVRMSENQYRDLAASAKDQKMSVSDFIRKTVDSKPLGRLK